MTHQNYPQIAIIGWGSLIWCPGALRLKTRWYRDGPRLPIEFARISKDGRLTLVVDVDATSKTQETLCAIADSGDIGQVRENLRHRERTDQRSIHSGTCDGEYSAGLAESVKLAVAEWLKAHPQIKGCVWTGLESNWEEVRKRQFSVEDAVRYLEELPDPQNAREYIQNAPSQIQTEVRKTLRIRLNWPDAELSPVLFEPEPKLPLKEDMTTQLSWQFLKLVKIEAKPTGLWNMALEYVPGGRLLRFEISDWDDFGHAAAITWSPLPDVTCGADGKSGTPAKTSQLSNAAMYGALIGKIGGGSADVPDASGGVFGGRKVFAVGSYCVLSVGATEGGPLFLTMNDSPEGFAGHSGALYVRIHEYPT